MKYEKMPERETIYDRIYEVVADIPKGRVATYGQIAWMAGNPRAPRVVGYAMRKVSCELNLPCHRVVNRLGEMAPDHVFGGAEVQRALLEEEGVIFLENGRIDMEKSQWRVSLELESTESDENDDI